MRTLGDPFDWLDAMRQDCSDHGVDVSFATRDDCFGYFDPQKRRLEVPVADGWLETLAHEYSHFCQEKEGLFPEVWPTDGPVEFLDAWGNGGRGTPRQVLRATRQVQRCELDAERRAVKLIRQYGLTHDLDGYLRRAWCNVMGYEFQRRTRKWWVEGKPYPWQVPEIRERIPARLPRLNEIATLSTDLETLFRVHCT